MPADPGLAVVTGAGRGIGRSIAIGLAASGAPVLLVSRSEAPLLQVAELIEALGGRAHPYPADVSSVDEVAELAAAALAFGSPSVLVNAAGVFGPMSTIAEVDPAPWIGTLQVNTFGAFLVCRALLPAMLENRWGRILNLSSAAALHEPGPFNSAYATSKAALNQFTRHLAAELDGSGVTANVFHPGDVKTEMWADVKAQLDRQGGPVSANYRAWVDWVDATGGDPPDKAVDLVLRHVARDSEPVNGEFLWIDDPLQPAVPAWPAAPPPEPSYLGDGDAPTARECW
jgi:NAD(P)-dependent dehydrogenase (short-subunit alcohol dehydrogenase family)